MNVNSVIEIKHVIIDLEFQVETLYVRRLQRRHYKFLMIFWATFISSLELPPEKDHHI